MKSNENNLGKNISRLVKLTGDSNKPSDSFTDSLIEEAVKELGRTAVGHKREEKDITMKANFKRVLSWAAVILIFCSLGIGILVTHLSETGRKTGEFAKLAYESDTPATKEDRGSGSAEIVYTEVASRIEREIAEKPAESLATQSHETLIAKLPKTDDFEMAKGIMDEGKISRNRRLGARLGKEGSSADYSDYCLKETVLAFERAGAKQQMSQGYPMAHGGTVPPNAEDVDAMFFKNYGVNPFVDTEDDHMSTFATDVDTGSYTIVRGYLQDGHLPPEKAVRVEEFVNYFKYGYLPPQENVFAVYAEASPWRFGTGRKNSYLLRLALKAKQISEENRKPAVLTFVIDVSGSMNRENRLGLVKKSLRMLIENLKEQDRIGIAVYGSRGIKVMEHKGLNEKSDILAAIESLHSEGSTHAEEGIRIGYEMAQKAFKPGCINRVILCSDGVANVGRTGADGILELIKEKADKGVTLSAIGFGMGNYNDVLMERLGDKGNGYYIYIDTIAEAKRIFADNLTGTLEVVARDVKVQVDFNPEVVRSYRLIGYENRDVPDDKFRDDKYDGGEIGAGHSVTALYELKLWPGKKGTAATTFVRYKDPQITTVTEFKSSIKVSDFNKSFDVSSSKFRLASTVAEFAEILRKSYWAKGATLESVLKRAQELIREFEGNTEVIELVDLVSKTRNLMKKTEVKKIKSKESVEALQ